VVMMGFGDVGEVVIVGQGGDTTEKDDHGRARFRTSIMSYRVMHSHVQYTQHSSLTSCQASSHYKYTVAAAAAATL
jgi:hypothetical protein